MKRKTWVSLLTVASVIVLVVGVIGFADLGRVQAFGVVGGGCSETINAPSGWTYTWGDEFNGATLDNAKWQALDGQDGLNNDISYNVAANAIVADGMLKLKIQKRSDGQYFTGGPYTNYWSNYYDTAKVTTRDRFNMTFGRVEICSKAPAGYGFHSSYWLIHNDTAVAVAGDFNGPNSQWPPELDIVEVLGRADKNNFIFTNYHWLDNAQVHQSNMEWDWNSEPISDGYHVYAVEWEPNEIRWYFDGELMHTFSDPAAIADSNVPMKLVMDTEVGTIWSDTGWAMLPDADTPALTYNEIKYVRAYTRNSDPTATTAPTITPGPTATPRMGVNLVSNPGFESPGYWDMAGSTVWSFSTADKHTGLQSMKAVAALSYGGPFQMLMSTLAPNTTYNVSFWQKGAAAVRVVIQKADWSGTIANIQCSITSSWTQCNGSFTTDATTTTAIVQLQDTARRGTSYVDDLVVISAGAPTPTITLTPGGPTPTVTNTPVGPTPTFTATSGGGNTHTGSWAAKGTLNGSGATLWQRPLVTKNRISNASLWIKGTAGARVTLKVLGIDEVTVLATVTCTASTSWAQCVTPDFNMGSNGCAFFRVYDDTAGGTVYIDDAFMGQVGGPNKITNNPGFELGNSNWTLTGSSWQILQNP